jgi:hypothetical protein
MRYMLLVYRDDKWWDGLSVQDRGKIFQDAVEYSDSYRARGVYLGGDPLEPIGTATTVRMKDGKALLTDGPFAETKEQLLGLYVVDCATRDAAVAVARDLRRANPTAVYEIRPVKLYLPGAPFPATEAPAEDD